MTISDASGFICHHQSWYDNKLETIAGAMGCPPHITSSLPLFIGGLLCERGLLFLLLGAVGLGLFLCGFLLVRFRRSVTHNNAFVLRVNSPAA